MAGRFSLFQITRRRQIGLHLLIWLAVWLLIRYYFAVRIFSDNDTVVQLGSYLVFAQTVAVYYGIGHVIFPRFLYNLKLIPLATALVLCYFLVYVANFYGFQALQPFSNGYQTGQLSYVERIWTNLMQPGGLFGCFTSLKLALWNYGYSLFFVSVLLFIKAFRDTINYQNRLLRLERDKLSLESRSLQLERDNLALELNFLKAQINPHFLFNTLNSIYTRTIDVDEQAADLILKLSDLMRYGLYESNVEAIALAHELDYIRNYLGLEEARYTQQQTEITFTATGNFDQYQIAPLLLISFVENAFKHGVNLNRTRSFVHVAAALNGNTLHFTVQNTIPTTSGLAGLRPATPQSGGVGLDNVQKRLDLLYPGRHQLTIQKTAELFDVQLSLQLQPFGQPVVSSL
ncbi:sensor histidine kinase [Spirosoma sp. KUDC1026]|uniref:sensor histidine kinase n=1 Tax=Spirosoma sp. KUDC1026 TaxID=2745947 RepID=UPI00159B8D30|nr:histidine kinase [Spirosoma sp. KUDC1026]QKZ11294.1 sensor histidine kinase [Spirosoma sp. KUDC1026]